MFLRDTDKRTSGGNRVVLCRCDSCQEEYEQRQGRNTDVCATCRRRAQASTYLNTGGPAHNKITAPPREDLEPYLAQGRGAIQAICKAYGVTAPPVYRWLKEYGLEHDGKRVAIPDDFVEWYKKNLPMKTEIMARYGVAAPLVSRWIKDAGLSFKGATTLVTLPPISELIALNQTLDTYQLADRFQVSTSKIVTFFKQHGVPLNQAHYNTGTSKEETSVYDFVEGILPGWERRRKGLMPTNNKLEVDLYHPQLNLAIEYDGVYHHSLNKDPLAHRKKLDLCAEQGIRLVRICSEEWLGKRRIIESMLKSQMGRSVRLGARETEVRKIGWGVAEQHHEQNHLSGAGSKTPVNFGLYQNDVLISVMSFARSRYTQFEGEWEISRFSTKLEMTVVGGASKLFKAFLRDIDPASVLSFSDIRIGSGQVYRQLGFELVQRGAPTYYYYELGMGGVRHHRMNWQKKKISKSLPFFDQELTEVENMRRNRFYPYWDCGSDLFIWKKK